MDAISNRTSITFYVDVDKTDVLDESILNQIRKSPNTELPRLKMDDEALLDAIYKNRVNSFQGTWRTIVLRTYLYDGKLLYSTEDDKCLKIQIIFP
jgi:hypothetical protein